ncbi:MAG: hypothetical protein LBE57_04815 [Methanosarcinales archaeon]|jgi:fatty acid-binding protein DegV|nr:hypothetical protein [Methanosarcinales archaeon]
MKTNRIVNRGRPKKTTAEIGKMEEVKVIIAPALKRELERKARNRDQNLAQFVRRILKDADAQLGVHSEYSKKREDEKKKRKEKTVILKFRINPVLKNQLEQKASNRNMYFSELIRDILFDANTQMTEHIKSEYNIKTGE